MKNEFSKFKGKCVLVTRPAHLAATTVKKLKQAGAKVIHFPLIEIAKPSDNFKSLDRAIGRLETYDWIVFTSQNAVTQFFDRLPPQKAKYLKKCSGSARQRVKVNKEELHRLDLAGTKRFAVVGPATAAALKKHGIRKIILPHKNEYNAAGLVKVLKKYDFKNKCVLFPSAKNSHEILPKWFKEHGAKLDKVEAYQTIMPKNFNSNRLKRLINKGIIDVVLFYSESAKRNFVKIFKKDLPCMCLDGKNNIWIIPQLWVLS